MKKLERGSRLAAWILSAVLLVGLFPLNAFAADPDEGHKHTEECYKTVLICEEKETAGHTHEEKCWQTEQVLVCEEEHEHTEECYEEQSSQVCGLEESDSVHTHTDKCYEKVLVCEEKVADSETETGLSEEELAAVQQLMDSIDRFLEKYDPQHEYDEEELKALKQEQEEIQASFEALSEKAQLLVTNYDAFAEISLEDSGDAEKTQPTVSQAVSDLTGAIDQFLADFDPEKDYTKEEQAALIESLEKIQAAFEALSEEEQLQVVNYTDLLSAIQDGGGVFFTETEGAASIGEKTYASLEEALDAAQNGEEVVLQQDIDLESYCYLKSGNSVTLNLNGHNITSASTAFMVKVGSELTLTGSGTISGNGYAGKKAGGALVVWGGVVNLEDDVVLTSTATDLDQGGVVWMYYGTFNMHGGRIEGGSAKLGGGVGVSGCNRNYPAIFNMTGGVITDCYAEEGGGVVVDYYGTFNMSGGMIEGCTAELGAGIADYGNVVMSGGEIVNNSASYHSAGVYADNNFTMTGGKVAHNKAVDGGNGSPNGVGTSYSTILVKVTGGAVYDNENGDFLVNGMATISIIAAKQMQADGLVFTGWQVKPDSWSSQKERFTTGPLPDQALDSYSMTTCIACYEEGKAQYSQTIALGGANAEAYTLKEAQAKAEKMLASPEWNKEPIVIEVGKTLSVTGAEEWSFDENAEHIILERADSFDGYLVDVKGSLKLEDITIQGLGMGLHKKSLIKVESSGSLTIGDGTILQNNGAGIDSDDPQTFHTNYDGGAVYARGGKVTMTGGVIRGNATSYVGGGVSVADGGTFTMTGGEISGNDAYCGGGVSAVRGAKIQLSGGEVSGNTAMKGGGVCVGGGFDTETANNPELVMEGGSVSGNLAKEAGGGIYVQMNSMATITAGDIIGNETDGYGTASHRGGGIYVNGGPGANSGLGHQKPLNLKSGLLKLENVEITGNYAPGGGGLAACPTSQIEIYVTDGAVFHHNTGAGGRKSEIALDASVGDKNVYYVSDFMLGGGMYRWYVGSSDQLADPSQYQYTGEGVNLSNVVSDEDIEKAQDMATVRIADNTANFGLGGGIASNGAVIIGNKDKDTGKVVVTKQWDDNNNQYGKRPESIEVSIRYGAVTLTNLKLTAENNWTVTRTGLSQEILAGLDQAELKVEEVKVDGYAFQGASAQIEGDTISITLTNRYIPTGKVIVTKQWDDNDNKYGKRPESIEVSIRYGAVTLTNLKLTAENNWTATKTDLSLEVFAELDQAELKVEEIKVDGYAFQGASAQIEGDTVSITLTNRYIPPLGSLRISKTVTGRGGDRTKDFTFNITLRDGNGTALRDQYPFTGKGTGTVRSGGTITLRHGESVTISGLPAGTTYTVTEVEANRDGYTTTASGNQGVIVANSTASASFVNDRPGRTPPTPVTPPGRPDDPDDDDDDPEPPRPTVPIPDPDVPRSPTPTPPSNLVTIMDPNTPLANQPTSNLVTIMDPLMPLGNLPITGGYGMALVIAGAALLSVAILRKK